MGNSEAGSAGRAFTVVLSLLAILGLGGAVVYLLSDINHRHYRLGTVEHTLVVERGRMLPIGFKTFEPKAADLVAAYAPIAIPPGESLGRSEIFEDRADVDRALFSLLASWARERFNSTKPGAFELAAGYVRRCELLPGLSEEQRIELRSMRADIAYKNGRRMLGDVVERLKKARAEFVLAKELGTSRPNDVDMWIADVDRRIRDYHDGLNPMPSDSGSPSPNPDNPEQPGLPSTPKAPGEAPQPKWRL
ncbi:MAG: hypothetical protein V3T05_07975 [Myxococcota bacterium]